MRDSEEEVKMTKMTTAAVHSLFTVSPHCHCLSLSLTVSLTVRH